MDTKGACPSAREVGWQRVSKCLKSIQLVYSRNEPRFQLFTRTFFFFVFFCRYVRRELPRKEDVEKAESSNLIY